MNWFVQHIPNYVDVDPPQKILFDTTKELLNIEVVKRYGQLPDFSHFAIHGSYLMEISNNGFHWIVVGRLGNPTTVDLLQWDGGKYKVQLNDGTIVDLIGKDVRSSCGDLVTLRDGTIVKKA